ncbi:MAG TPA: ATP-binding protein [Polyangia bacterium]|nr:ATP-binding protein [Polyangia bacterium]
MSGTALEYRALVLAPIGRDAELACQALGREEIAAERCADMAALCRGIATGAGVVLLAEEALTNEGIGLLKEQLARQPPWSGLPILILTGTSTAEEVRLRMQRLVELLGNVTLLERPLRVLTLVTAVRTALRARARQYDARQVLEDLSAQGARLRENERALSTLLSNLPGMAFRRVLDYELSLEFVSEGSMELTGYRPDELQPGGRVRYIDLIHPEDLPRIRREMEEAAASGAQLTTSYRIRTASGREKWIWDRSRPILGPDGGVLAAEGFATDISEQRRHEQEQARQVEFEQQLIGIVSHDLRNPLSAMMMGASRLLQLQNLDPRITRTAHRIVSSGERATRMISDLLDFTKVRLGGGLAVERQSMDLHDLARQIVEEVGLAHPGRRIEIEPAGDGCGHWDSDRLAQLITNLLHNALSYSPPETPVRVRIKDQGDVVALAIHNLGHPIPPPLLPRLFEPLQRGPAKMERASRSIGLGLYIVKHIVLAHEGTVDVRSVEGEGTTFTVRLPREPRAPARPLVVPASEPKGRAEDPGPGQGRHYVGGSSERSEREGGDLR